VADSSASCESSTYVLPGDVVAVGKTCGTWAYVQYIGEKHITKGWLSVADLGMPRTLATRPAALGNPATEPVFELTRGKNVPACQAYLQRLKQTQFSQPAYCGRPEDDRVPGFQRLQRVMLSATEVERRGSLVETIAYPLNIDRWPYYEQMNANGGVFPGTPRSFQATVLPGKHYSSWRYTPEVDIDNDGTPDDILIWNIDELDHPDCGGYRGPPPGPVRADQWAFILTKDGRTIDQARTIEIFGHPDGGYLLPTGPIPGSHGPITFLKSLRLMGNSYGVFRYRNLYYFETFYDHEFPSELGDFRDQRKGSRVLQDTLAVFLRRDHKTLPVCEYHVTE
jgi:hypothetical protein